MCAKTTLFFLLASFAFSAAVTREEKQADYLFDKLDANNNGKISLDEAKAFYKRIGLDDATIAEMFANADTNKDGGVTKEEFKNYATEIKLPSKDDLLSATFDKIDSDNDGYITLGELKQFYTALGMQVKDVEAIFKQMDKNGNGRLSLNEFKANANA